MAQTSVQLIGQDKVNTALRKLGAGPRLFDRDVKVVAQKGVRLLKKRTNRLDGTTRKGWDQPVKKRNSLYFVINEVTTQDKKHSIANILDKGRKEVRPLKPKKRLYIPLNKKGRSKKLGAKIPTGFKFGKDFVFAKKSKAFPGTKFIQITAREGSLDITRRVIKTVRRTVRG